MRALGVNPLENNVASTQRVWVVYAEIHAIAQAHTTTPRNATATKIMQAISELQIALKFHISQSLIGVRLL